MRLLYSQLQLTRVHGRFVPWRPVRRPPTYTGVTRSNLIR